MTAETVAQLCSGRVVGQDANRPAELVADSRTIEPGRAFVAVRGGHGFVREAVDAGAAYVVVESAAAAEGATAVVVDDTVRALGELATWVRSTLDVPVVAITGSFGKTLTKDFVAAALSSRYRVHAAPGSYNTEVGLPLMLLVTPEDTEVLVVELGARRPGEIAELCAMCRPTIGVLTGVGTTHLEIFGSRDAIARAKAELVASLPADGLAAVPSDDDYLPVFTAGTSARVTTVGPGGETRYAAAGIDPYARTSGTVALASGTVDVVLPIPGRALMRNAAMAMRVAVELGVEPRAAAHAIAGSQTTGARMEVVRVGGWTVVNDAYNANPNSVAAGLRTMSELRPDAERWAVLGAMAELGPMSEDAHVRIGRLARSLGYEGVIVVGDDAGGISRGAGAVAHPAPTMEEAADLVARLVPKGSVVLVKGSLVTGLRLFPDALRAQTDRAAEEV
ncbi:MAG: UDP-N-acetylmuramoyl-tripeptide--D-alanyl-D-alanine ligase [Actinomycetota bacterium]